MKKTMTKGIKIVTYSMLGIFLAFIVYANLEPAPMHVYVKPISMTILKVDGLKTQEQATDIRHQVSKATGVTACSANPASKLVSITFDPDQTSATFLGRFVSNLTQQPIKKASFEGIEASGPQCPVPLSYILAFERVKYAFCFR
jgi:copper chaperone CopZ